MNGDQAVEPTAEKTLPAGLESIDRGRLRLRITSTTVVIQLADASIQRILAAKQYLLGEVATARGDAVAIAPDRLRSDPALDWLLPLMIAADADRNGFLDESEIRTVVNLLTEGRLLKYLWWFQSGVATCLTLSIQMPTINWTCGNLSRQNISSKDKPQIHRQIQ